MVFIKIPTFPSIFVPMLLYSSSISRLVGIDGFGTRRIIGSHIGISQNLSKPPKSIKTLLFIIRTCLIIATHSAPSSPLPYMIPLIGKYYTLISSVL